MNWFTETVWSPYTVGIGIGILAMGAMQSIGRNPEAASLIQTNMILAIALTEAIAIYALVVALVLIFVGA